MTKPRCVLLPGFLAACTLAIGACTVSAPSATPSPTDVDRFLTDVSRTMMRLGVEDQRAAWVAENFITTDMLVIAAGASEIYTEAIATPRKP